eukprot:4964374-Pyramimonas_sp.AAC.1
MAHPSTGLECRSVPPRDSFRPLGPALGDPRQAIGQELTPAKAMSTMHGGESDNATIACHLFSLMGSVSRQARRKTRGYLSWKGQIRYGLILLSRRWSRRVETERRATS